MYGVCYKDGIFANTKMKFDFFSSPSLQENACTTEPAVHYT